MITWVLDKLHNLESQNKSISTNWIPSHVGIHGNKVAGKAAKEATLIPAPMAQIAVSLAQIKQIASIQGYLASNANYYWVVHDSPSAKWYTTVKAPLVFWQHPSTDSGWAIDVIGKYLKKI